MFNFTYEDDIKIKNKHVAGISRTFYLSIETISRPPRSRETIPLRIKNTQVGHYILNRPKNNAIGHCLPYQPIDAQVDILYENSVYLISLWSDMKLEYTVLLQLILIFRILAQVTNIFLKIVCCIL
jgi:hypothetical protein